jgi:hypothetical protein
MTQYDDTNRGKIWPNKKKETDKHPDFTGSLNVDGKDYWVSAWRKKPDAAERAPSLTFQVKQKDGKPMDAPRPQVAGGGGRDMDDEIPFSPEFR